MSAEIIAEKYATALFESATAAGSVAPMAAELESVAKAFGDQSAMDFFSSP